MTNVEIKTFWRGSIMEVLQKVNLNEKKQQQYI